MGCSERKETGRRASRLSSKRRAALIIHHPLSTINRRAFTLVELLVVISLIAILMAILVPVVGRARRMAKATVCQSTVRQWGQILGVYTTENKGWLGRESFAATTAMSLFRGSMPQTDVVPNVHPVSLSADTSEIRCCPAAEEVLFDSNDPHRVERHTGLGELVDKFVELEFKSPRHPFGTWKILYPSPGFCGSYGFNGKLLSGSVEYSSKRPYGKGVRVIDVLGRAEVPALFDCSRPYISHVDANSTPPPSDTLGVSDSQIRDVCLNRHYGFVNTLFTDWSVRRVGLKELWTLRWDWVFDRRGPWTRAGGVQPEDWPRWMRNLKDY